MGKSIVREYGDKIEKDITPISERYKGSFFVGAAVEPYQLEGGEGALLAYHFNSLTAENVMKFRSIHPEPGVYNFEGADKLVKFARENKMQIRGHTFVWHHPAETAPWVFTDEKGVKRSREDVLSILEDHMAALLKRYGNDIQSWDVVNEAIDTSQPDNLRRTQWYDSIGPDYVEQAFIMAHKLRPKAELFLNEYDTYEPGKREALYNFVKELLSKNVPIDGVGFQMHLTLNHPQVQEIENTISMFRDLGLKIYITELDMSLYTGEFQSFDTPPEDYMIRQAHRYKEIFNIFEKNKDIIESVTFWGFNDGHTYRTGEPYLRNDWPLPFDADLKSKLAYKGIIQSDDLPEDVKLKVEKKNLVYLAPNGTPKVDAQIDDLWSHAPVVETSQQVTNSPGAVASVRILWDEKYVYVLAEVKDGTLSNNAPQSYMNDSFEVFLDEHNDKAEALGNDDYQFRIGYNNSLSVGGWGTANIIDSAARVTDDGYLVELRILLQKEKGEIGRVMGIDFQVNDNFGNASREGISKWNDPTNESWRNTSGWGSVEFVE